MEMGDKDFDEPKPDTVCACIPARYASSRLPGKLLYDIGGQTILERTCRRVLECKWISRLFIMTDHEHVADAMNVVRLGEHVEIILKRVVTQNGTERIGKNLDSIPQKFRIIVIVQGDEPFIDPKNVDYMVKQHITALRKDGDACDIFFSTLHQKVEDLEYLQRTSCVKVIVNERNNAMLFTRNVVPWNKEGVVRGNSRYFSCTGLYAYNRERIEQYVCLEDTEHQLEEDVEQLKVLDQGYVVKTYECPHFNEISVNTIADYNRLRAKYGFSNSGRRGSRIYPRSLFSGNASNALGDER